MPYVHLPSRSGVVCEWVFQLASDLEQQRQRGLLVGEAHENVQTSGTPSCSQASVPEKHGEVLDEIDKKNSREGSHISSPATTCREQKGQENEVQVKEEEEEEDKSRPEKW